MPNLEEAVRLRYKEWLLPGNGNFEGYSNLSWWYWLGYCNYLEGGSNSTISAKDAPDPIREKAQDAYKMGYADAMGDHDGIRI